jgi:hypothetical protein
VLGWDALRLQAIGRAQRELRPVHASLVHLVPGAVERRLPPLRLGHSGVQPPSLAAGEAQPNGRTKAEAKGEGEATAVFLCVWCHMHNAPIPFLSYKHHPTRSCESRPHRYICTQWENIIFFGNGITNKNNIHGQQKSGRFLTKKKNCPGK